MTQPITIAAYFETLPHVPIIDVRTPAEFAKGHIPGAFNVPLFSNEERVQVGTTYKQQSREAAILLGFDLAGPKWSAFIKDCLEIAPNKQIVVHCWRGGMRSGAMAWALDLYGFKVYVIKGGYKQYRAWVRQQFDKRYSLQLLGGMTGSGKTTMLHQMKTMQQAVIDLEALANHQGSAYGSLNKLQSPTQEQFENDLAKELFEAGENNVLWMEDECRLIGKCAIPLGIWQQMKEAKLINWEVPKEQRVQQLLKEYGSLDKEFLISSTERISKRLGPKETRDAIIAINEDRIADFIRIVLVYYDKTYNKGLQHRKPDSITSISTGDKTLADASQDIIDSMQKIFTYQPNEI